MKKIALIFLFVAAVYSLSACGQFRSSDVDQIQEIATLNPVQGEIILGAFFVWGIFLLVLNQWLGKRH